MSTADLEQAIDTAFENRDSVNARTKGEVRDAVTQALAMLDSGQARVAEPLGDHQWQVNQWLKKAVLLSFRLNDMVVMPGGAVHPDAGASVWWDKVAMKFSGGVMQISPKPAFARYPGALCGILRLSRRLLC